MCQCLHDRGCWTWRKTQTKLPDLHLTRTWTWAWESIIPHACRKCWIAPCADISHVSMCNCAAPVCMYNLTLTLLIFPHLTMDRAPIYVRVSSLRDGWPGCVRVWPGWGDNDAKIRELPTLPAQPAATKILKMTLFIMQQHGLYDESNNHFQCIHSVH